MPRRDRSTKTHAVQTTNPRMSVCGRSLIQFPTLPLSEDPTCSACRRVLGDAVLAAVPGTTDQRHPWKNHHHEDGARR